ncbi:polysaccharide pyruvyl transferase family protein [Cerasicoccus frondis]|uniref:polysaccharide pyruvyl transferase family protein n=1 Tax=Cerasicoccus frondis TaxID=490090 RepID=UPI002852BBE3|nr:polysaccharide pyruvyl transferase family protein [Cerasicoccus frondis]
MRIGVLTYHRALNYGALLQCHAMLQTLEQLGAEASVIDYRLHFIESSRNWRPRHCLKPSRNRVKRILRSRFDEFSREHLPLSERTYRKRSSLTASPPAIDALILGSDQIWNQSLHGGSFDTAFLGDFGPASLKRIAYAASFGGDAPLEPSQIETMRPLLKRLDAISVREAGAAATIKSITGTAPKVVPDPSLLLASEAYARFEQKPSQVQSPFIFMHALQYSPEIRETAGRLSELHGAPVVLALCNTTGAAARDAHTRGLFVTPGEWLWLIRNAACVVTNSFHATAFSLLFQTPFVVVPLGGILKARNQRLEALLTQVGLQARTAHSTAKDEIDRAHEHPIPWDQTAGQLTAMKAQGLDFLRANLQASLAAP